MRVNNVIASEKSPTPKTHFLQLETVSPIATHINASPNPMLIGRDLS